MSWIEYFPPRVQGRRHRMINYHLALFTLRICVSWFVTSQVIAVALFIVVVVVVVLEH